MHPYTVAFVDSGLPRTETVFADTGAEAGRAFTHCAATGQRFDSVQLVAVFDGHHKDVAALAEPPEPSTIEAIAAQRLGITSLKARTKDSIDSHNVTVWALRSALQDAFNAGRGLR